MNFDYPTESIDELFRNHISFLRGDGVTVNPPPSKQPSIMQFEVNGVHYEILDKE